MNGYALIYGPTRQKQFIFFLPVFMAMSCTIVYTNKDERILIISAIRFFLSFFQHYIKMHRGFFVVQYVFPTDEGVNHFPRIIYLSNNSSNKNRFLSFLHSKRLNEIFLTIKKRKHSSTKNSANYNQPQLRFILVFYAIFTDFFTSIPSEKLFELALCHLLEICYISSQGGVNLCKKQ